MLALPFTYMDCLISLVITKIMLLTDLRTIRKRKNDHSSLGAQSRGTSSFKCISGASTSATGPAGDDISMMIMLFALQVLTIIEYSLLQWRRNGHISL